MLDEQEQKHFGQNVEKSRFGAVWTADTITSNRCVSSVIKMLKKVLLFCLIPDIAIKLLSQGAPYIDVTLIN